VNPDTLLYVIAKNDLEAAFQSHPAFAAKILRGMLKKVANKLRAADDTIQTLVRSVMA